MGFFSLTDLQSLYGSLRDGDYWAAFKRSVYILNSVVNPATGVTAVTSTPVDRDSLMGMADKLEQWCDGQVEDNEVVLPPTTTANPGITEIHSGVEFDDVLNIVYIIVNMLRRRRK